MRRLGSLVAAPLLLAFPMSAEAQCTIAPAYQLSWMRTVTPAGGSATGQAPGARFSFRGPEIAVGLNHGFSDGSGSTFDLDAAYPVMPRLRLGAGVGLCDPDRPTDSERTTVIGALVTTQLLGGAADALGIVAQVGVNRFSEHESTFITVPLIVGVGYAAREETTLYAGPMLQHSRSSYRSSSYGSSTSRTDPGAVLGVESLIRRDWTVNGSIALVRVKGSESCFEPGECYGEREVTKTNTRLALRLSRALGSRR